ncbi:MAG TPA: hypothetical protein PLJ08_22625 [Cyclobacteriaceae bacterium]|nr:hypothetical protein [Cyclobacteriaceae bacterium]
MNIIMNNLNGFTVVLEQQVGFEHERPEYNTKFAVSITPSRHVAHFGDKEIRSKSDTFYIDSWDVAMRYYKDLEKYATQNKVN